MAPASSPPGLQASGCALRIEGVSKSFGGVQAVGSCHMTVGERSVTGLIGPNGSGKTTLFNVITGMAPADGGVTYFRGRNILGLKPHEIFRLGMSRTFQVTRIFRKMTVMENLRVAAPPGKSTAHVRAWAEELLKLFNLWELRDAFAEDMSYGQQKLLEFARALVPEPAMVMLDEPFAGVNRVMAQKLVELIRRFQAHGTTFFLIDHEMKIVMEICDLIYVMDFGQVIAEGKPDAIRNDPRVLDAYFGS
jgi:ABC-type branched-subunit amino acid transport system ATPase component